MTLTTSKKIKYEYLHGQDAELTSAVERLLTELGIEYSLKNREQHLIASFETAKLHVWATTMKWRVGDGTVKRGTFQKLRADILTLSKAVKPEPPIKTEAELDTAKLEWLMNGGVPPHQQAEFKGYKEELLDFYRKHQKALEERAHQIALASFESMLKNKAEAFESLELHHTATISDTLTVTKVVGGWLYTTQVEATNGKYEEETKSVSVSTTFVPEITPLLM